MLKWLDAQHFEARSAGEICGHLHPFTVKVLKEIGIDLGQKKPKSIQQVRNEEFDYGIRLGQHAPSYDWNFRCKELVHWKFDDVDAADDWEKQLRQFRIVRDQILQRLRLFVLVHVRSQNPPKPAALSVTGASRRS